MPLRFHLNASRVKISSNLRTSLSLLSVLLLTSCTTTNIPGLDRIFFPNSTAQVGPLIDNKEQYPQEDEVAQTDQAEATSVPTATDASAAKEETKVAPPTDIVKVDEVKQAKPTPKPIAKPEPKVSTKPAKALSTAPKQLEPKQKKSQEKLALKPKDSVTAKPDSVAKELGTLSGQVILIGDSGKPLPATGTLITLTPQKPKAVLKSHAPKRHVIDMEGKEYLPRFSSINAGDQVVFVNKDNIRHNVFSSSGGNAFDLGTYGAGLKRAVTLKEPGIVKIYCNIHADMATFVAVGDSGLSAKADEQGKYRIANLAPGKYEVSIWNIRGETKRIIDIKADETAKVVDRIDTTAFTIESHKNKFGGNYSKNAALFEDEFY